MQTGITQTGTASEMDSGFIADMGTAHLPPGATIGGILLDYTATRATAGTDPATSQLQLGIICQDETVSGEVERPLDDPHADWMWQQQISFPAVAVDTTVSTFDSLGGPIRIRAKRRCEELGMHLWLVSQGWDIAPTFDLAIFSSVLLILP